MPCWWESISLDGSCLPHLPCSQLAETCCVGSGFSASGGSRTTSASWGSIRGCASRISGCISSPDAGGPHP